jgi:hypothetical protein
MLFLQFIVLPHNYLLRNCYLQQLVLSLLVVSIVDMILPPEATYDSLNLYMLLKKQSMILLNHVDMALLEVVQNSNSYT